MMTCWPMFLLNSNAIGRARISELPPGGEGMMKRIGFVGKACARTAPPESASSAATHVAMSLRVTISVPLLSVAQTRQTDPSCFESTVHGQRLSVYVASRIAAKEPDGRGDLLLQSVAVQRNRVV